MRLLVSDHCPAPSALFEALFAELLAVLILRNMFVWEEARKPFALAADVLES